MGCSFLTNYSVKIHLFVKRCDVIIGCATKAVQYDTHRSCTYRQQVQLFFCVLLIRMVSSLQRQTVGLLGQRPAISFLLQLPVFSSRGPQRGAMSHTAPPPYLLLYKFYLIYHPPSMRHTLFDLINVLLKEDCLCFYGFLKNNLSHVSFYLGIFWFGETVFQSFKTETPGHLKRAQRLPHLLLDCHSDTWFRDTQWPLQPARNIQGGDRSRADVHGPVLHTAGWVRQA